MRMKPPPLFLALITVFLEYTTLTLCMFGASIPDECIKFESGIAFENSFSTLYSTYTNHLEDEKYLLHCHISNIMVIHSVKNGYGPIVKISKFGCTEKQIREKFYMFASNTKLALGFYVKGKWCRYDYCKDCSNPKIVFNHDVKPKVGFFRWSKISKDIYLPDRFAFRLYDEMQEQPKMIAEYISIREPTIVLNCYETSMLVRTAIGQRLFHDKNGQCEDNFIQTLHIFQMKRENEVNENVYRLGGKDNPRDWSWVNKPGYWKTWANYFKARKPAKTCYWRRIPSEQPNTCEFLKHKDLIVTYDQYLDFRRGLELIEVAIYYNLATGLTLRCYKHRGEVLRYFSIVSDHKGDHVVTIILFDCSSLDNFKKRLVVETREVSGKKVLIVGTRRSTSEEWCSYSITTYKLRISDPYESIIWVYYGYIPDPKVEEWYQDSEGDLSCPVINGKNIDRAPAHGIVLGHYLSPSSSKTNDFLLKCLKTGVRLYGIIRTLKGELIVSIPGLPCESWKDLNDKSYMYMWEVKGKHYIRIGSRPSRLSQWCSYDFCWDCEGAQARLNFEEVFIEENQKMLWTEAGSIWKKVDDSTSYYDKDITMQYVSEGVNTLVLMRMKSDEDSMTIRNMVGSHFAKVPLKSVFEAIHFSVSLLFLVKKIGEAKYEYIDCNSECVTQLTKDGQETWMFYLPDYNNRKHHRTFVFKIQANLEAKPCLSPERDMHFENIKPSKPDFLNGRSPKTTYFTSIDNDGFVLECYGLSGTYYAVFTSPQEYGNVFTWHNFDCSSKDTMKNVYIHAIYAGQRTEAIILESKIEKTWKSLEVKGGGSEKQDKKGFQSQLETENIWCMYGIFQTAKQVHLRYTPAYKDTFMTRQWYDDESSCPSLKKEDVTVGSKPQELLSFEKMESFKIYLGVIYKSREKETHIIVKCYKIKTTNNGEYYSAEIVPVGDGKIVVVHNLNCLSRSDLDKLYVAYEENPYNLKSMLALGLSSSSTWCRYDICLSCEVPRIMKNINEDTSKNVIKWSEDGVIVSSRPDFKKIEHGYYFEEKLLQESSLKKIFYSKSMVLTFIIRCYKSENQYVLVVTSHRGVKFTTFTVENCLEKQFVEAYVYITRSGIKPFVMSLSKQKSRENESDEFFCWYHGCTSLQDPTEEVVLFFFYKPDTPNPKGGKGALGQFFAKGFGNKPPSAKTLVDSWSPVDETEISKRTNMLKEITKREDITFGGLGEYKTGWNLVANFKQPDYPGFELLCFKTDNDKVQSVILDSSGSYVFTLLNHKCEPGSDYRLRVAVDEKDESNGKEFVFVLSGLVWISVCRSCKSISKFPLYAYNPGRSQSRNSINWIKVNCVEFRSFVWVDQSPGIVGHRFRLSWAARAEEIAYLVPIMLDCPLKREDIYFDESATTQKAVRMYISNNDPFKYIVLYCYNVDGGFVSVISYLGTYRFSFRGRDCSTADHIMKIFVSTAYDTKDALVLGTLMKQDTEGKDLWCSYVVDYKKKTVNRSLSHSVPTFPWFQVQTDECALNRDSIYVEESQITLQEGGLSARYISDDGTFILSCYKMSDLEYALRIRKFGVHVISIKGLDCSSYDKLVSGLLVYPGTDVMTVGFLLYKHSSSLAFRCLYRIEWDQTATVPTATVERSYTASKKDIKWAQIPTEDPIKKKNIKAQRVDKFPADGLVTARYLSDDGYFLLYCYTKGVPQVTSKIFNRKNSEETSVEGMDCSTTKALQSTFLSRNENTMTIGAVAKYREKKIFWCMFEVAFTSTRADVQPTNSRIDREIVWIKLPLKNPLTEEDFSADETKLPVLEDKLHAKYLASGQKESYFLNCYKTEKTGVYISIIRKLTANSHLYSIRGIDCSSSERLDSYNIGKYEDSERKIAVSFQDNKEKFWWLYEVDESGKLIINAVVKYVNNDIRRYDLAWTKEGVWVESAGLRSITTLKSLTLYSIIAEEPDQALLGLECYKDKDTKYYIRLRNDRGLYSAAIPYPSACTSSNNLMQGIYIHVGTELLRLNKREGREKYISLMKDPNSKLSKSKFWFYNHSYRQAVTVHSRLTYAEVKGCSPINRNFIIRTGFEIQSFSFVEVYNGGSPVFTLRIYESIKGYYAILSTEGFAIKTGNFKLLTLDDFDKNIFVDNYAPGYIIVGNLFPKLCAYIIPINPSEPIIQILDGTFKTRKMLSRWYKADSEECPSLKREDIFTERDLEIEGIDPQTVYVLEVKKSGTILDTFILFCYKTTSQQIFLTIYRLENYSNSDNSPNVQFLASIKNFDCLNDQHSLEDNVYMFMIQDEGLQSPMTILAFGTKPKSKDWCQYDICITNCMPTRRILVKACYVFQTICRDGMEFEWTKKGIHFTQPTWKEQTLIEGGEKFHGFKERQDLFITRSNNFFIECVQYTSSMNNDQTSLATLRTVKGLLIATIENMDCIDYSKFNILGLSHILMIDSEKNKFLRPIEFQNPPDKEKDACWFYGCAQLTNTKMILFLKDSMYSGWYWRQLWPDKTVQMSTDICPVVVNNLKTYLDFSKNSFDVVAKHKYSRTDKPNVKFTLNCYLTKNEYKNGHVLFYNGNSALSIWDEEEQNHIATIRNIQCFSVEFYEKFDMDIEEHADVKLIFIELDTYSDCIEYSIAVCPTCKVKSWRYYEKRPPGSRGKWTIEPTQHCINFENFNIRLVEMDLTGYKLVASYISEGHTDEETLMMKCYKNKIETSFVMRLETLSGEHVVSISDLDCTYHEEFNRFDLLSKTNKFYTSIDGKKSVTVITPGYNQLLPNAIWCQFKFYRRGHSMSISHEAVGRSDDFHLKMTKWSMGGKAIPLTPTTPSVDMSENIVSKFQNIKNPDFTMTCLKVEVGNFLTILSGANGNLYEERSDDACSLAVKLIYILTTYNDDTYSLARLNVEVEPSTHTKTAKKKQIFIFDEFLPSHEMSWKMVAGLNTSLLNYINFDESKEFEQCSPTDKSYEELIDFND